jgi:hypothetical protein
VTQRPVDASAGALVAPFKVSHVGIDTPAGGASLLRSSIRRKRNAVTHVNRLRVAFAQCPDRERVSQLWHRVAFHGRNIAHRNRPRRPRPEGPLLAGPSSSSSASRLQTDQRHALPGGLPTAGDVRHNDASFSRHGVRARTGNRRYLQTEARASVSGRVE